MNNRTVLVRVTVLLILTILGTQLPNPNAASPTLSTGTWWTLKGTYEQSVSGTGTDQGSYTETGTFVTRFFVVSSDSNTMTISQNNGGTYSCSAQGTIKGQSCTPPTNGTWANTREYTFYTNTLLIQSSLRNGKAVPWQVGRPFWGLTNPSGLTDGGTTPLAWCVPNSDNTDCPSADVQASVSTQQSSLKGSVVEVWGVSYTGPTLGSYQNSAKVYSSGPETDSYQYDPVYGIVVGWSVNQKFVGTETGGGGSWTETYSEKGQFVDSSLTFTVTTTVNAEPSANVYVTVDGVKYASSQLPAKLDWVIGSTHALQVDSTVQGAAGVQYVFVNWSDGSTDTSRSLTVTQDTTLTATYKTQYQLTVISDLGSPQGSGWYDAGTQATFSVSSPQPESGFMGTLGGKTAFQGWSGDSNAASPSATIGMDGPKTVTATWTTDNTQPYMVLGGIAAVIVIVAALAIFMTFMRRKKVSK